VGKANVEASSVRFPCGFTARALLRYVKQQQWQWQRMHDARSPVDREKEFPGELRPSCSEAAFGPSVRPSVAALTIWPSGLLDDDAEAGQTVGWANNL